MSSTNQTAGPSQTNNFTAIFDAATSEYQRVTGNRLDDQPFSAQLDFCDSPEAVSNVLWTQAQAFSKFRKGSEKVTTWLDPIVHILFTFSETLGEGIGPPFSPAKTIFSGIGVLLGAVRDVAASHDTLVHLFERIHFFLQRLKSYTGISLTYDMIELLGKIMAVLISILALSTKAMTERRIKKILNRLMGRNSIEDALSRLDSLTKEENLMTMAKNLEVTHRIEHNVKATKYVTMQREFREWLSPPDPSVNHNTACESQHSGTARWFIQSNTFQEWKKDGSILWVCGNPGAGKSILCSAIIEDIKKMQDANSFLIAYYYFDFKDALKRDVHGLLTSLLFQLSCNSDSCWDVLHALYTEYYGGSEQPSDADLAGCFESMLELPGQLPIFVIMDAIDECPITTGTPSAREKVLDFVEHLVSNHPKLFICITSRPEQDIQNVLNPLTPGSRRVSLHEEAGQRADIKNYVHSFVHGDRTMRRWRTDDKELVINMLPARANGMFRWAFCQLDTLRRCMPSSIRKALDELPVTLDETYERALEGIPKEKWQHAHCLFQCLIAAIRPLRVEELGEIFAIEFDPDAAPRVMEDFRPENPEEAVLSTCSTLIAVINDRGSKKVQFSHFSVREFLTSDRLWNSEIGTIRRHYISLDAAHTILARACLTELLQLDETLDIERLATFPLASYAAWHWVYHAKYEDVALRVQDVMERLFDPRKSHLAAWIRIHDVDWIPFHRSLRRKGTALYYAVLCGFNGLARSLIDEHTEDINAKCGYQGSPLHAALYNGDLDSVRLLLDHGADANLGDNVGKTPLVRANEKGNPEAIQLLLEHGADERSVSMHRFHTLSYSYHPPLP